MKMLLGLIVVVVLLSGCVTHHEKEMAMKKNLCVQFGMTWQEFQFPELGETDIICLDEKTGEHVYMELVPEKNVRPSVY
jgi:hypothetical protein